ncbi:MAG: OmpA family protein [Polyangiaceae bacterium]
MKWLLSASTLLAATVLVTGCENPEPKTADSASRSEGQTATVGQAAPAMKDDASSPTRGNIAIDDRILKTCGNLPAPKFAFDSAAIRGEAADVLNKVGACFATGPLKDREVKLVGRADPRGPDMHNFALGQDRAASVARFLEKAGMTQTKIRTMSKGAIDATGTDKEGWALDRRVDILLVD